MVTSTAKKAVKAAAKAVASQGALLAPPTLIAPVYRPYPWQARLHASKARFKWVWAGRRAGKGRAAIQEVLDGLEHLAFLPFEDDRTHLPDPVNGTPLIPPIHIWTVAPTKSQMLQVWHEMKEFIPAHFVRAAPAPHGGRSLSRGWKEDELNVWLDFKDENGFWLQGVHRASAFWELKTGENPEALQTVGLDILHITEAQDLKEVAWNKVRPTLNSPGRYGRAIIEGIPPLSKGHWNAKMYRHAAKHKGSIHEAFHASTFDNPGLSIEQIQAIEDEKQTTPLIVWERNYLAKQSSAGGNFFRRDKIDAAAIASSLPAPIPGRRYVAGLDLGKRQDFTVLIIKDASSRTGAYAIEMQGIDWASQFVTIKAELDRWHVLDLLVDSTGLGDVIYDSLLAAGLPARGFQFTAPSKYQIMHGFYIALEQGTVTFPTDWEKLTDQLSDIQIKSHGTGYSFVTESGGHDDWVMAELLALQACDPAPDEFYKGVVFPHRETVTPLRDDGVTTRADPIFALFRQARARKSRADIVVNGEPVYL